MIFYEMKLCYALIETKTCTRATRTSYLEAKTYEICGAIETSEMFSNDLIQHKYYKSMFTSLFVHSLKRNNWKMLQML